MISNPLSMFDRSVLDADAGDQDDVESEIDLEDALQLVAIERRRYVVELIARQGSTPVRELSEFIAIAEGDESGSRRTRRSVYVGLIRTHLPQLDRAGIVDYDDDWKIVGPGPNFEEFWSFVQDTRERFRTDGGGR